ncbi:MAG: hypothetical protein JSR82_15505 [Verrucomicrobia bacterium]|nr:hypothetical protein [Verrucomicrobiota bacterium]
MKLSASTALAFVGAFAFAPLASANLFVNPGFENSPSSGLLPQAPGWVSVGAGTRVDGWVTTQSFNPGAGSQNILYNLQQNYWIHLPTPLQGTTALQLDSSQGPGGHYEMGSSLYQTVTLAANTNYVLSFNYRGEQPRPFGDSATMGITVANVNDLNTYITSAMVVSAANQDWQTFQITFQTTAAGDYRFTFIDGVTSVGSTFATSNFSGGIDNNMIVESFLLDVTLVPETSTYVGFGLLGLAGIGWTHRRGLRRFFGKK